MKKENAVRKNVWPNQQADLLEILRCRLNCTYISDLRIEPYNSCARALLDMMDLSEYPCGDVINTLAYVYAAA